MLRRETNARLRDPIMVRSTSSELSIYYHCSFGFFWIIFYPSPHYKALPFYLIISPVPTCLAHNCETSRRFAIPICCHPCLKIKFPLIPHQCHTALLGFSKFQIYFETFLSLFLPLFCSCNFGPGARTLCSFCRAFPFFLLILPSVWRGRIFF